MLVAWTGAMFSLNVREEETVNVVEPALMPDDVLQSPPAAPTTSWNVGVLQLMATLPPALLRVRLLTVAPSVASAETSPAFGRMRMTRLVEFWVRFAVSATQSWRLLVRLTPTSSATP